MQEGFRIKQKYGKAKI